MEPSYRKAIAVYIRQQARPVDKYGHQPRLYYLACQVGEGMDYDDDVVYAACWLHDLGVFVGHRPEDPQLLAAWDHVPYTVTQSKTFLENIGYPAAKIPAVLQVIETHQPRDNPQTIEGIIVRDADILEQLGSIGILRLASKIGRDTRYLDFTSVSRTLRRAASELPSQLRLDASRRLAEPKLTLLSAFLQAVDEEGKPELF